MIIFKEKEYSSKSSTIKRVAKYVKKYPLIPISTASLSVGAANYAFNRKKSEEDLKLQKEQLKAMRELTDALTDTKTALEKEERARKKELMERNKEEELKKKKKSSKIPSFKPKKDKKK